MKKAIRFILHFKFSDVNPTYLILASPLYFQMAFILLQYFEEKKYSCESILLCNMKKQRYSLCL